MFQRITSDYNFGQEKDYFISQKIPVIIHSS